MRQSGIQHTQWVCYSGAILDIIIGCYRCRCSGLDDEVPTVHRISEKNKVGWWPSPDPLFDKGCSTPPTETRSTYPRRYEYFYLSISLTMPALLRLQSSLTRCCIHRFVRKCPDDLRRPYQQPQTPSHFRTDSVKRNGPYDSEAALYHTWL